MRTIQTSNRETGQGIISNLLHPCFPLFSGNTQDDGEGDGSQDEQTQVQPNQHAKRGPTDEQTEPSKYSTVRTDLFSPFHKNPVQCMHFNLVSQLNYFRKMGFRCEKRHFRLDSFQANYATSRMWVFFTSP